MLIERQAIAEASAMKESNIPEPVLHESLLIQDVIAFIDQHPTTGTPATNWVATVVDSWPFIIGQTAMLILWVILTVTALIQQSDSYPFTLMNLNLSLLAFFTSRVIMMSQNRQSAIDRLEVHIGARHVWPELFPAVDGVITRPL